MNIFRQKFRRKITFYAFFGCTDRIKTRGKSWTRRKIALGCIYALLTQFLIGAKTFRNICKNIRKMCKSVCQTGSALFHRSSCQETRVWIPESSNPFRHIDKLPCQNKDKVAVWFLHTWHWQPWWMQKYWVTYLSTWICYIARSWLWRQTIPNYNKLKPIWHLFYIYFLLFNVPLRLW